MKSMEILKLDNIQLGLSIEQVEEIKKPFLENAEALKGLKDLAEKLYEQEITKEICARARELRLDIVKVRTGSSKIKDTEKADILKKGNAIQFCNNLISDVAKQEEEKLERIEKHFENLEKERIAKLQAERLEKVKPFIDSFVLQGTSLGMMSEEVFEAFFNGAKSKFEQKKAQEEKEAKEKAEKEAKEKVERERIAAENERLKKQNEKKDEKFKKEREAKEKAEKEAKELKEKQDSIVRTKDFIDSYGKARSFENWDLSKTVRRLKEDIEVFKGGKFYHMEKSNLIIVADVLDYLEKELAIATKQLEDRIAQERLEKEGKYKKFLSKNGVSPETEKDFVIRKEDGVVKLFKLVDTFKI